MQIEVETVHIKFWKEKGILCCKYAEDTHIDLEIAKHCVQERINFSDQASYPCFVDMRNVKSASKQAREYLAGEGAKYVKAGALLIGSALTKTIGNIFLSVNKPPVPTKLFTDETEAKEWLKQYL